MRRIKTLIHLHTDYSYDCNIPPERLIDLAERKGIGCVAVTDHDTIEGAWRAAEVASGRDVKVIVGEEVSSADGHIIGLFLRHGIEAGMSARETALSIREQGGLVLVPHPFTELFGCGMLDAIWDIADLVDAIEVFNAQNILPGADRRANRFAECVGLTKYVGSDTHLAASLAPSYQWMRPFEGPADFLDALSGAKLNRGRHPLWYFASAAYRTARYHFGLGLPLGFGANYRPVAIHGLRPASTDMAAA